jgi:hypothetical protein
MSLRRVSFLTLSLGGLLLLAIAWLARFFALEHESFMASADVRSRPVEKAVRHQGLDLFVCQGLRLPPYEEVKAIRIGSLILRRKKLGFIRLAALNECVLTDVRVVLDPSVIIPRLVRPTMGAVVRAGAPVGGGVPIQGRASEPTVVLPVASTAPGPPRAAVPGPFDAGEKIPRLFERIFEDLRTRLMTDYPKVSGLSINGFQLLVGGTNDLERCLLHADTVRVAAKAKERELQLTGHVMLRTLGGETLTCESLAFPLLKGAVLTARKGILETSAGSRRVESLSFDVRQLFCEDGHFLFEEKTASGRSAVGRHTFRTGVSAPKPTPPRQD